MKKLILIEGPTGVGKTAYAIQVAQEIGTEIISADSRQFYKELNIGVARPSKEELSQVQHHLIAHISIHDPYDIARFEQEALNLLNTLFEKYSTLVLVGGSGLYVKALCQGLDDLPNPTPGLREKLQIQYQTEGLTCLQAQLKELDPIYYGQVDILNPQRLMRALEVCLSTGKAFSDFRSGRRHERPFEIERIALRRPREELYQRINLRVEQMLQEGLLEEVRSLLPFKNLNALNTVGYKELFPYFDNKILLNQAIEEIKTHSRHYAKRQLTWLRAQENIHWVEL